MTEKSVPYVDENLKINENAKMSEKVRWFTYDCESSGIEETISETNSVVAKGDIDTQVMLDADVGRDYFYASMDLAINVIKSFENEVPQ